MFSKQVIVVNVKGQYKLEGISYCILWIIIPISQVKED